MGQRGGTGYRPCYQPHLSTNRRELKASVCFEGGEFEGKPRTVSSTLPLDQLRLQMRIISCEILNRETSTHLDNYGFCANLR